ncbi:HlyD family secretion protein/protease secretion system membrane fusion protein/epimerase transport system membrane fusion protein [Desulfobotulus alkaliphilus]|uniref:HlyD family secretion protein/protease secretion system membrane fusion protein/epimerase transport system membrane fusion protein n=1 Tax=Desulfobotulus alkaliphilus TaxID=622671 RepID=A0A562RAI5_9BACT|nr:HlyD family type I secretion periplasmic adaptor subunit [Desulfobotulus alkaliphilus]TWI66081.1 HlyD family secretion protein/protease secretion system membrane fusion protein/epimerase transport system membrane fusion protein [Desulfobotulus alkaliphilus]
MQNPELPKPDTNSAPAIITGFAILIFGFFGFVFWAVTAPLGKGIVCEGVVSVETHRKAVQHLYGGIVDEIRVRENEFVKKGDLLMRLSDVRPRSEYAMVRMEYFSTKARLARLRAERAGASSVAFPDILLAETDSEVKEILATQQALFERRMGSLQKEREILSENLASQTRYTENMQEVLEGRKKQAAIIMEELEDLRPLADAGHYPRNRLLSLERALEEVNTRHAEDLSLVSRTEGQIAELKLRLLKLEQDFLQDVENRISEAQSRLSSLKNQYAAALDMLHRTEIFSPEDGMVLAMSVHTIGGVISPGQKIMEIVPSDASLIIEARIQPRDIDRVHGNMKADLRFSAFDTRNTPVLEGDVVAVSADRLIDERTGYPYYLARVTVPLEELERLGRDKELLPGMPAEVVIKTGERTLMQYLIDPFRERLFVSFKEE